MFGELIAKMFIYAQGLGMEFAQRLDDFNELRTFKTIMSFVALIIISFALRYIDEGYLQQQSILYAPIQIFLIFALICVILEIALSQVRIFLKINILGKVISLISAILLFSVSTFIIVEPLGIELLTQNIQNIIFDFINVLCVFGSPPIFIYCLINLFLFKKFQA